MWSSEEKTSTLTMSGNSAGNSLPVFGATKETQILVSHLLVGLLGGTSWPRAWWAPNPGGINSEAAILKGLRMGELPTLCPVFGSFCALLLITSKLRNEMLIVSPRITARDFFLHSKMGVDLEKRAMSIGTPIMLQPTKSSGP